MERAVVAVQGELPVNVVPLPNGYTKVVLEWNERPDRDEEWYQRERKSNPEFDREYLLTWGAVVGEPVFKPLYKKQTHERRMEPLPKTLVMRGWDFGYTRPACVWAQFDGTNQLGIRKELLGEDETIDQFGLRVVNLSREIFGAARFEDYGDPAGHQRNDKSERTSIQILKDLYGIKVRTRPSEIQQGLERIRYHLLPRGDGRPGVVVDPDQCPILAFGFARGYVRDEKDPEKPLKDGYYDHLFDALRYLAIHKLKAPKRKKGPARDRAAEEVETERIWEGIRGTGKRRTRSENPVVGDW